MILIIKNKLKYLLTNCKNLIINYLINIINNYLSNKNNICKKFINIIYSNEKYLNIFKKINVLFLNLDEITPFDCNINNVYEIKQIYVKNFSKYTVLFF